uniref:VWFD domain-containing protein n=1 Tax=Neogobius melanostomus TaxID=47308 RepID=A0A8C6SSJ0_9GOBI
NGVVTTANISCPTRSPQFCANGLQPAKAYDQKGCCYDYECPCVCNVNNKNNYLTFDGKDYSFAENCTYYLVKEIIPKYNLTITMTKEACESSGGDTFCSQILTVAYQSEVVVLKQSKISGAVQNQVDIFKIYAPYKTTEILITGTDIVVSLKIAAIETTVLYSGSSIIIKLPQSLFGKNTEGQCGTCDNSQSNDCRAPNGHIESCSTSAGQWAVPGEQCVQPTVPPTPSVIPCSSEVCNNLNSSVFQECHKVVPVDFYFGACVQDVCENACASLEAYAINCAAAGVCLNWRNQINGLCETWTSDCKQCVCDKDSLSTQCTPLVCLDEVPVNCTEPGQQVVSKIKDCCSTQTCGQCACFTHFNDNYESSCQDCYCGPNMDPKNSLHVIVCKPVVCNTSCSQVPLSVQHVTLFHVGRQSSK